MILDSHVMDISEHLFSFTDRIREQDKTTVVWIDALCVDQQDDEDKGTQISLMPMIYASAYRTLI
jgi:hypothetical protein